MKMKKNLLKMALLAFATFAASVASAQTYSGKITSSDWSGDNGLESDVDYSLTYIESTKKLNFEFTVPCDKKIINAYFFAEHGFGETKIEVPQSVDGTYTLSGTTGGVFAFEKGHETWFFLKLTIEGVGDIVTNNIAYKAGEENTAKDTEAPAWVSDPTAVASSTSATISVNANDNVSTTLTYEVSKTADFATLEATVNGKANETTEIALKGLSPETNYAYYVRVKDMAGNIGDVKTVTFTTTEAPALEEVTCYGIAGGSDEANWINTVDGYFPTIEYSATTTAYNQMVFKIKLSEIGKNLTTPELWCDQLPAPGFVGMTKVEGTTNEFTATLFDENAKARGDQINFRFRFPMDGGAPMTKNIYMKVGDSNAKPSEDTTAPTWGSDPVAQNVTDKTAEIVVNVTDDSDIAIITLTGDNGFVEVKKTVKADGTDQTIALNGLTAKTAYNLTLAIADAAGNAGDSKTVKFTTEQAPDLEPLYLTIPIASKDWNNEAYNPNGSMLITVNPDNTLSFKVSLDQDREDFEETNMYVHGVEEPVSLIRTSEGVYECTTTKSISNRDALVHFHMYFRFSDGSSTFAVKNFTPSEGSTSAVAEVEAEAAKVVAVNGVIRVEGDKTFAVYTVAGQLAFRGIGEVRLDKGVYVVVVDGKAQKVML